MFCLTGRVSESEYAVFHHMMIFHVGVSNYKDLSRCATVSECVRHEHFMRDRKLKDGPQTLCPRTYRYITSLSEWMLKHVVPGIRTLCHDVFCFCSTPWTRIRNVIQWGQWESNYFFSNIYNLWEWYLLPNLPACISNSDAVPNRESVESHLQVSL